MFAIIPHKDCLFFLSNAAREIIRACNLLGTDGNAFSPLYPLWAFTETVPENILSLSILPPEYDGKELYFPVKLCCLESDLNLRINFARKMSGTDKGRSMSVPDEILSKFPLVQRSFRQALVVMENNGWKVFDEKWHKCK